MSTPFKFRRRTHIMSSNLLFLHLSLLLLLLPFTTPQESNNNFCGLTWDDASANCRDRQHCPSGTDDECTTLNHICFGGTLCDVTKGDGAKFAYADVPYEDISNTRFCGNSWDAALEGCSVESHCPSGYNEECGEGMSCYGGLGCNVQDLMEEMGEEEGLGGDGAPDRIGKDDPRRNQFCGKSWGDASASCSKWCPDADDSACPAGQTCFGETSCYYSEDFVPTQTPTLTQTDPPTTRAPSEYKDPANNRFCGKSWGLAVAECSIESSCKSGLDEDCPEGQTCHGGTTCNLIDLLVEAEIPDGPTLKPTMPPRDDLSNSQFCGESWDLADASCSLATHCPDGNCPDGQVCYGGTTCNAFDMTQQPTMSPSQSPTPAPTPKPTGPTQSPSLSPTLAPNPKPTDPSRSPSYSPTITGKPTEEPIVFIPADDIRHSYWCGKDWNDANTCSQPCTSGEDTECPKGQACFAYTECRPSPKPISSLANSPDEMANATVAIPDSAENMTDTQFNETSTPVADENVSMPVILPFGDEDNNSTISAAVNETSEESALANETTAEIETESNSTMESIDNSTISISTNETMVDEESANTKSTMLPEDLNATEPTGSPTANPNRAPFMEQLWLMTEAPSSTYPQDSLEWVDVETNSPSVLSETETESPSPPPSVQEFDKESSLPTLEPSARPAAEPKVYSVPPPSPQLVSGIGAILKASSRGITNDILLYTDAQSGAAIPTKMYQYEGFLNALSIYSRSLMGSSYFYFGDETIDSINYGLVNAALFLANAAIETVRFDICDDISWEKDVFGMYPISNACGQGGFTGSSAVLYENSFECKEEEQYMACQVDADMETTAATNGAWIGAPPPLECFPKTSARLVTGAWNPSLSCEEDGCDMYDDHVQGNIDPMSSPAANSFGRIDVQGCCWWGRGPFPRGSSGTCKIGKVNHFLGQKYYKVDFCKTPEAICSGSFGNDIKNAEVKWVMGMLYWIDEVQSYDKNGWSYIEKIHEFVDGALSDKSIFDAIATIVSRGCHDCGRPTSLEERKDKFDKIVAIFGNAQSGTTPAPTHNELKNTPIPTESPSMRPLRQPTNLSTIGTSNSPVKYLGTSIVPTRGIATTLPSDVPSLQPSAIPSESSPDLTFTPSSDMLSSEELANRIGFANSYCASSLEDAKEKCSIALKTCNEGDPPCIIGTACFGNVVCSIPGSVTENDMAHILPTDTAASVVSDSPSNSLSPSTAVNMTPLSCGHICLRPLTPDECVGAGNSILIFSDCVSVGVGQVCQSLGECGPKALIHNCRGHSVYMRALPAQCEQIATVDGVVNEISPPSTQPSPAAVNLNDVFADKNSKQNYGSIEGAWWRDVPFNGSAGSSLSMTSCFSAAFIILYTAL